MRRKSKIYSYSDPDSKFVFCHQKDQFSLCSLSSKGSWPLYCLTRSVLGSGLAEVMVSMIVWMFLKEGLSQHCFHICPEFISWIGWRNGTFSKEGWQPELWMPLKCREKPCCLASKIGPPHGTWGSEKLSPSFGQPCFPETIGKGMQKELCPFREGWEMKWCKSNGWTCLWSLETCIAFGYISFPLTLIYVQIK